MSSWAGFTDRLRGHARLSHVASATKGYLNTAADRIEDLESKLYTVEADATRQRAEVDRLRRINS